jgi:hypothetical protein
MPHKFRGSEMTYGALVQVKDTLQFVNFDLSPLSANATYYYLCNLPSTLEGSSLVANIRAEYEAQQLMRPMAQSA